MSTHSPTRDITSTWQFVKFPREGLKQYCPEGYHPVTLGDVFNNGQYKVLRKLGFGADSTVWLAHDLINKRYVALKILAAKHSKSAATVLEVSMRDYIGKRSPGHESLILQLLDEFEHRGVNGVHTCLVFEPMAATVNSMVEELPEFKPLTGYMEVRYPLWMGKSILKQYLQALALLHSLGIAHGDVQPGNMLFSLKESLDAMPEDAFLQQVDPGEKGDYSTSPIPRTGNDELDRSRPLYFCAPQPLTQLANIQPGFQIKLSDLGCSYFIDCPPAEIVTPVGLRAPELVLTNEVHKTQDIWSFGCLIFELVTGQRLFNVCWHSVPGYETDEHLLMLSSYLGPLPEHLYQKWKTSHQYFTPERKLYNCGLGGVEEGKEPLMIPQETMEDMFEKEAPVMSDEEASQVKALVRRILQYDPAKRPSAADLLNDPWFL